MVIEAPDDALDVLINLGSIFQHSCDIRLKKIQKQEEDRERELFIILCLFLPVQ